jgi:hypothetical protein
MYYRLTGGEPYREHGSQERAADPTPETIQLMASALRMRWSPREERARRGMTRWRWQAPHCPPLLQDLLAER